MVTKTLDRTKLFIQSTRDQVLKGIKEMILDNTFSPGEVLQIDRLSKKFGVSITPIREALIRLEGYGLVTMTPNKSVRVAEITVENIRNTWEMRTVLEPYAARITASIEGLDAEWNSMREGFIEILNGKHNLDSYIDSDIRFHTLLYQHLPNPFLRETVERVRQLSMRMRYFPEGVDQITESEIMTVTGEHLEIVDALLAHDADRSSEAVRVHIRHGLERTLVCMERAALE